MYQVWGGGDGRTRRRGGQTMAGWEGTALHLSASRLPRHVIACSVLSSPFSLSFHFPQISTLFSHSFSVCQVCSTAFD